MTSVLVLLLCHSVPHPVQWPVPRVESPPPSPSPRIPIVVAADQLFVVTSDAPCVLIASPEGKANVSTERGPITIRGKFVGGTSSFETRTFSAKTVFVVEPTGSGAVELVGISGELNAPIVDRRTLMLGEGPKPDPKPPEPTPAPIAADGLHVLIVIESSDAAKLAARQVSVLTAKPIRDYLEARCPKVGGVAQFRIWDKDVNTANESKLWQSAFGRPRGGLPWIVVSNGKSGFEGPLPASVEETLTLLKRFGGE